MNDLHSPVPSTVSLHHLAGAYAVGALPLPEQLVFEAWLDEHADDGIRAEVHELIATATLLADEAATAPPPALRDAVLAMAHETRQLPPIVSDLAAAREAREDRQVSAPASPRRRFVPTLLAGAAAAVALVAGATIVSSQLGERLDGIESQISAMDVSDVIHADDARLLPASSAAGVDAKLVLSSTRGEGVLFVDGLTPAPQGMVYELWLLRTAGPARAGLFDADASGRATQLIANDLSDVTGFAVTLEPAGGSDSPTSTPLLTFEL